MLLSFALLLVAFLALVKSLLLIVRPDLMRHATRRVAEISDLNIRLIGGVGLGLTVLLMFAARALPQ